MIASLPLSALAKQLGDENSKPNIVEANLRNNATSKISKKLYGSVDEVDFALKAVGLTLESKHLPALVDSVRLGSPAHRAGLEENDKLITAKIIENKFNLVFQRDGKLYGVSLHTAPANLTPAKPISDKNVTSPIAAKIRMDTETDKIKEIAKYNLVLIVDKSGSMNEDVQSLQETKWQWCNKFVSTFAEKVIPSMAGRGITLVPFNETYSVSNGLTPAHVLNFFKTITPSEGTDLGSPLREVLQRFSASDRIRPLLVVIITDGLPNTGPSVEKVLIEFSNQLRSEREVRVLFLEVGDDSVGDAFFKYVDEYLVNDGAKFDFVDVMPFKDLKNISMIEALQRAITESQVTPGMKFTQGEIDELKKRIERQRKIGNGSDREIRPGIKKQQER